MTLCVVRNILIWLFWQWINVFYKRFLPLTRNSHISLLQTCHNTQDHLRHTCPLNKTWDRGLSWNKPTYYQSLILWNLITMKYCISDSWPYMDIRNIGPYIMGVTFIGGTYLFLLGSICWNILNNNCCMTKSLGKPSFKKM